MSVRSADTVVGSGAGGAKLLATVLAGSWRPSPSPLTLSPAGWDAAAPRLLATGAGGLGWWRIRGSDWRTSPVAEQLHQAYRLHSLQAAVHEELIPQVFSHCRAAGVEPLLGKGWTVARLYPESGLRPYGDIDLFVRPDQHRAALELLASPVAEQWPVDLHLGFPDLADRPFDELYSRSRLVQLGTVAVRVLGPEDHLRHLCLHLLRHGAWRPLWLCDIGAALESQPAEFDWDCCLRGSRRRRDNVACAVGLANQILGARVEEPQLARRARRLPRWLLPAVDQQWVTPYRGCTGQPIASYLRDPRGLLQALRVRWPNAIEATFSMQGPFNDFPRLPFKLVNGLARLARFILHLPRSFRKNP